jgi:hypothetical protein
MTAPITPDPARTALFGWNWSTISAFVTVSGTSLAPNVNTAMQDSLAPIAISLLAPAWKEIALAMLLY